MSEWVTGIVVISEVVAPMYVVLSEAEKHVAYGELVGTTECKSYNRGVAQTEDVTIEFSSTLYQRYKNSPKSRNCLKTQGGRRVKVCECHIYITRQGTKSIRPGDLTFEVRAYRAVEGP